MRVRRCKSADVEVRRCRSADVLHRLLFYEEPFAGALGNEVSSQVSYNGLKKGQKKQFRTPVEILFLQVSHTFLCQDVSWIFMSVVS